MTSKILNSLINYEAKQTDLYGKTTVAGKLITTDFDLVDRKSSFSNFWRWLFGSLDASKVSSKINSYFTDSNNESAIKKYNIQDLTIVKTNLETLNDKFTPNNSLSKAIQVISRILGAQSQSSGPSKKTPSQPMSLQTITTSVTSSSPFRLQSGDNDKDAAQEGLVSAISRNKHFRKVDLVTTTTLVPDADSWKRNNTATDEERAKRGPVPTWHRDPITGKAYKVAVPAADKENPFVYKRPVLVSTTKEAVEQVQVSEVNTMDVGARLREHPLRQI